MASRVSARKAKCPLCDAVLEYGFIRHLRSVHNLDPASWGLKRGENIGRTDKPCPCGRKYRTWEGLYAHWNKKLPQCVMAIAITALAYHGDDMDD